MEILSSGPDRAHPIAGFDSRGAAASRLGEGSGPTHVYALFFEPGGEIGPHPAGFGQLFIVTEGSGWISGEDGQRSPLNAGQMARIAKGEIHAKGSERGMIAIMVQIADLAPFPLLSEVPE